MPGRLEVICGPMFAGKSTELIRRLRAAAASGLRPFAFKPVSDTRSGHALIRTHLGEGLEALPLSDAAQLVAAVQQGPTGAAVVGLDEAHFFGPALIDPVRALLARGDRVIIAGVERDHRGLPFEPFPALLCEADEVIKLVSKCAICGKPAIHSQRMFSSDAPIVVGGAESYQARCRDCFQPG